MNSPSTSAFRPAGPLVASPLSPYGGPWNARLAAHLLRRAGFGGTPDAVRRCAGLPMRAAVASLVNFPATTNLPAGPQLPDETALDAQLAERVRADRGGTMAMSPQSAAPRDPAIKDLAQQRRKFERQGIVATQLWWLDRMIATPAPLQEKMTLLWHGHFTTAAIQKGVTPAEIVAQNALFRQYALGNVRELTQRVSVDPAMLKYLDNRLNEGTHPNENFARELMELYTLGIGNYSEADVREAARAWSGLRIRRGTDEVFLNARLHDDGSKSFLGRTGNFSGRDVVEIIFQQPAAATFFATKLLRAFVYDDPEPELVGAFAALLGKNDFNLAPVLSTLFASNVFYSERAYRALVKSPVEFVVSSYQLFGCARGRRHGACGAAPDEPDPLLSAQRQRLARRQHVDQQLDDARARKFRERTDDRKKRDDGRELAARDGAGRPRCRCKQTRRYDLAGRRVAGCARAARKLPRR